MRLLCFLGLCKSGTMFLERGRTSGWLARCACDHDVIFAPACMQRHPALGAPGSAGRVRGDRLPPGAGLAGGTARRWRHPRPPTRAGAGCGAACQAPGQGARPLRASLGTRRVQMWGYGGRAAGDGSRSSRVQVCVYGGRVAVVAGFAPRGCGALQGRRCTLGSLGPRSGHARPLY
jgi:hypothetical protein